MRISLEALLDSFAEVDWELDLYEVWLLDNSPEV